MSHAKGMARRIRRCRAWLLLVLLIATGLTPVFTLAADPWRVVILPGADPTQPAVIQLDGAFRRALLSAAPRGVEFFTDPLDNMRFRGANLTPGLLALLQEKYAHQKVDLVVGLADYSLDFAESNHEKVWPHAPVLIYGLDEARIRQRTLPPEFAFMTWRLPIAETLVIVEALHPTARRLIVIGDDSAQGRSEVAAATEAAGQRPGNRWTVEAWTGLSIEEVRTRLAALDSATPVIYTVMYRDSLGRSYFPAEALRRLVEVSRAPIYGWYPTYLEPGLTAGALLDFERTGERAAGLAAAILGGRPAAGATAPAAAPRCIANVSRVQAFGLNPDAVPAGCELAFAPPSLWREHRVAVLVTLAALALQAALIAGLLWQRRQRRLAEAEAAQRRIELARGSRLAAMGELSASIAHEIGQPLGAILSNTDAAELMLQSGRADQAQLLEILSDIRRDDLRAHEVIRRLRALLRKQQIEHAPLDLHDALQESLQLLAPELRARGVRVESDLSAHDAWLVGDRIQIQQVALNLVRNAIDALGDVPPASRVIDVATADVAGGIEFRVADPGHGIAAEHQGKVFESFFTTKPLGMGMGLSIVRSIVEAHGGTVTAEARAEQGTVFRVWLPRRSAVGGLDGPDIATPAASGASP